MSRETASDFKDLLNFIANYSLVDLTKNPQFIKVLSEQHKKYFSFLTAIAELTALSKKRTFLPSITDKQLSFIIEACSDLGSAMFLMASGAYKASKIMMRSSIETFLKGLCLAEIVEIDSEKSIYKMFEDVKELEWFQKEPNQSILNNIHSEYKILCKDAHTATAIHMQQITALKYFPNFNLSQASSISTTLMFLASSYTTLVVIIYNNHFHNMHHDNKKNIIDSIPKEYRRLIQGID